MSSNYANEWSTGLCGCTHDCHSCWLTWCCPCVSFGRMAEILDRGEVSCCGMGCVYCLLNLTGYFFSGIGCAWIISMGYRTKLRRQYGIEGGSCRDCLTHFCCMGCALCQEYRELQIRGFDVSAGWEGNSGNRNIGITLAPAGEEMKR